MKNKGFEFENVGKRMPYDVPEGFMDEAKRQACELAARQPEKKASFVMTYMRPMVAAASIAILAGIGLWAAFRPDESQRLMNRYENLLAAADYDTAAEFANYGDADFWEWFDDDDLADF